MLCQHCNTETHEVEIEIKGKTVVVPRCENCGTNTPVYSLPVEEVVEEPKKKWYRKLF
jgi:uncharacterized Zn finger protein